MRWARKTAQLTRDAAALKLGLKEAKGTTPGDRLKAIEDGEVEPTRSLLVKMAKVYHRPLLTFYLSRIPKKADRGKDFRTLPAGHSEEADALLDALLRDVQARHGLIRAALEEEEDTTPLAFVGSMTRSDAPAAVADRIRDTIELSIRDFRTARNASEAFKVLRSHTESAGVFVLLAGDLGSHHTTIGLEVFRGYAIADEIAPFVVINHNDDEAAWSFTLVHELAHLWLGQTGVSGDRSHKRVERFCNDVAGEFLLPQAELQEFEMDLAMEPSDLLRAVSDFARPRNISASMVAYKLYKADRINGATWRSLSGQLRSFWQANRARRREAAREQGGGPSYYVLRRHRLGQAMINTVGGLLAEGAISTVKAGRILGVKPRNVAAVLEDSGNAGASS